MTGNLIEKSDVYSFGVVLVELLTGVKPGSHMTLASNENINIVHYFLSSIENNDLRQILTFRVADESEMEEVEIVAELASECLRSSGVKRPTMKRVSEELDSEETEHLLGESSTHATAVIAQPNTQTFESFDIENYSYNI
ncbi:hypothetical protein CISIN_1g032484mg [Citrus sinensis]|uniref:Protein kinase domain-containing protein n=1 Tax=Citrus sinensis TaxID=2711 RepID=A0A067DQ82_CITSI|nr:hypothetical protein CISIN_1g032484mg [Citrus sinensis]